eukprot:gene13668-biopygen349
MSRGVFATRIEIAVPTSSFTPWEGRQSDFLVSSYHKWQVWQRKQMTSIWVHHCGTYGRLAYDGMTAECKPWAADPAFARDQQLRFQLDSGREHSLRGILMRRCYDGGTNSIGRAT